MSLNRISTATYKKYKSKKYLFCPNCCSFYSSGEIKKKECKNCEYKELQTIEDAVLTNNVIVDDVSNLHKCNINNGYCLYRYEEDILNSNTDNGSYVYLLFVDGDKKVLSKTHFKYGISDQYFICNKQTNKTKETSKQLLYKEMGE